MTQSCDITKSLNKKHCVPCEGDIPALPIEKIKAHLATLPDWQLNSENNSISRVLHFKDFYETMAYVNAIAWISHQENHHPDLTISYNRCAIHYMTHAIQGLTENDFICAAKVDALLKN